MFGAFYFRGNIPTYLYILYLHPDDPDDRVHIKPYLYLFTYPINCSIFCLLTDVVKLFGASTQQS